MSLALRRRLILLPTQKPSTTNPKIFKTRPAPMYSERLSNVYVKFFASLYSLSMTRASSALNNLCLFFHLCRRFQLIISTPLSGEYLAVIIVRGGSLDFFFPPELESGIIGILIF